MLGCGRRKWLMEGGGSTVGNGGVTGFQPGPSAPKRAPSFTMDPMTERQPLGVDVDCYAGHRGEQTPRTLILGERRVDVADVLDAWLGPDYRYFKLRGADGDTYLVRHDERSDTWELTMFRAKRLDGP